MLSQLLAAALVDVVWSLSGCSLVQKLCIDALISLEHEPNTIRCVELWLVMDSAMSCFVYKYRKLLNPRSQAPGVFPREVAAGCKPVKQDDIINSPAQPTRLKELSPTLLKILKFR